MRRQASHPEVPREPGPAGSVLSTRRRTELALFLRRWLANPLHMGAIAPSGPALARAMARAARMNDAGNGGLVVELGPGTGAVTRALIRAGIEADRLVLVERDRHLHAWLERCFPRAMVLHSDARRLDRLLIPERNGPIATVVSSLPLNSLPRRERDEIVRAAFRVLTNDGTLIQYSYGLLSPLPGRAFGVVGKRVAFVLPNLPPATVWRFSHAAS